MASTWLLKSKGKKKRYLIESYCSNISKAQSVGRRRGRRNKWTREMELWEKIRVWSLGTCDRWSSWISCLSLCDSSCSGHFVCSNSTMEVAGERNLCFPTRFSSPPQKKSLVSVAPCEGFVPVTNWNARQSGKRCKVSTVTVIMLFVVDENAKSAKKMKTILWRDEANPSK